jgi:ribosomal protein L37AE/L43A
LSSAIPKQSQQDFLKYTYGFYVNNWSTEMNESNGLVNNLKKREDYECPECGNDCGDLTRHTYDDIAVIWYFTCEKCGIDFGGDL